MVVKSTGVRDCALAPMSILEILVGKVVESHRQPCLRVLDQIRGIMLNYLSEVADKRLGFYPFARASATVQYPPPPKKKTTIFPYRNRRRR